MLYCPWPEGRQSIYQRLGKPKGIAKTAVAFAIGFAGVFAFATRARPVGSEGLEALIPSLASWTDAEDSAKTNVLGIFVPFAISIFEVRHITHPSLTDYLFHRYTDPIGSAGLGIVYFGMALVLHVFAFVPYERVPFLKYVVGFVGIALFFYGAQWAKAAR